MHRCEQQLTPYLYGPPGHYALKPGTFVRLKHCANGYPLPVGIKPGDLVKILGFDHGYYGVEQDGRTFTVFMTNVIEPQILDE